MPLALSCQSSEEGTVVVVNLTLPEGATPPADTELLHLETSHDRTRRRTQELQPPPLRFGLRAFAGFEGTFFVDASVLDATFCPRLQGVGQVPIASGQASVELTIPLAIGDCSDPAPLPPGSLDDVIGAGVPADIRSWFSGASGPATPDAGPRVLYPFDNSLTAPNVNRMQVDWKGTQTYYRVLLLGAKNSLRAFITCQATCSFAVPDNLWRAVGLGNTGGAVTLTVAGVSKRGGPIAVSDPIVVRFSPEELRGGLYYFSPSIRGIARVPLGANQPASFITNGDGTGCAGCHAVSRDGRQVAAEFGGAATRVGSTVVDGVNPQQRKWPLSPSIPWNFAWFNPAGDQLITNWQGDLALRDAKTGQVLKNITRAQAGAPSGAAMPEWSPDGKWLAYVRLQTPSVTGYDFDLGSGEIVILPYNGGQLGPAVTVVPAQAGKEIHFFPSWSPDSQWLVFNTLTCGNGPCQTYNASQTRLRLVRAIGDDGQPTAPADPAPVGAQRPVPLELLTGAHQPGQTTNWPKFSPFLQGSGLTFIVYSAKYSWGLQSGGTPQLFFFGVDLKKAREGNGVDPSYAPIWLPFQDQGTANHSAIWTTDVVCNQQSDCPSEFSCSGGVCAPVLG